MEIFRHTANLQVHNSVTLTFDDGSERLGKITKIELTEELKYLVGFDYFDFDDKKERKIVEARPIPLNEETLKKVRQVSESKVLKGLYVLPVNSLVELQFYDVHGGWTVYLKQIGTEKEIILGKWAYYHELENQYKLLSKRSLKWK